MSDAQFTVTWLHTYFWELPSNTAEAVKTTEQLLVGHQWAVSRVF